MKNFIFTGLFFLVPACSLAQQTIENPLIIPEFYAWSVSPNVKWITCLKDTKIYNVETNELFDYPDFEAITATDKGMIVGRWGGRPAILYNGQIKELESLKGSGCYINDISASGNRVCGMMNNREKNIRGPFCCDIDSEGNSGEPVALPHPDLDLFKCEPQFINALKISEDGKTIGGFIQDWRGMYAYPIIYQEDDKGEWSYSLPSEYLFNPDKIEIPVNPWLDEPEFPEPTNFMDLESKFDYEESISNALMGLEEFPDVFEYMTPEQYEEYAQAVESYNEWYYSHEEAIKEYVNIYRTVVSASVEFSLNDIAINPNGRSFISSGVFFDEDSSGVLTDKFGFFYFDLDNKENNYGVPTDNFDMIPVQLLPDNTMVASNPIVYTPQTYLVLPGTKEFITVNEYFSSTSPSYLAWMNENLYEGRAGYGKFSSDRSVFIAGVLPDDCYDYDKIAGGYYSFTHVFNSVESGVETIEQSLEKDFYNVFNLQGINVLNTHDYTRINELPKGVYLINGKKVLIGK